MPLREWLTAAVSVVLCWPAWSAAQPLVFAANRFSNDATVVDADTFETFDALAVGPAPADVVLSPASRFAYVALAGDAMDPGADTVVILDVGTRVALADATVGDQPVALALSADGRRLFVANAGRPMASDGSLTILDTRAARGVTPADPVLATVPLGGDPGGVAVSPDGRWAYVTNTMFAPDNVVFVVDVELALSDPGDAVVDAIAVGNGPLGIALSEDGRVAYVANSAFGSFALSIVDLEAGEVRRTVSVGSRPADVALSPDGRFVYVSNLISGSVSIVERETERVRATVAVGAAPSGIAFHPDGAFAWVANRQSLTTPAPGTLSVIDTRTAITAPAEALVATIDAGDNPTAVAISASPSEALIAALFARVAPEDADVNLDDRVTVADLL